jgi:hypothetical protein
MVTCIGLVIVLLGPTAASAQGPAADGSGSEASGAALTVQLRRPAARRPPFNHPDSVRKAALAGAAVGALVGVMYVGSQCEDRCEAGAFALSIVYFGALGAGIGAMIAVMPDRSGVPIAADGRVRIASSITRTRKAGLLSIRF